MMERWTLPEGWEWKDLSYKVDVFAGSSAPQNPKYFENGKYPFVRVSDLSEGKRIKPLLYTRDYVNDTAIQELSLVKAKAGTIVFPKSGAAILTNNRALLGMDAYIVSHLAGIYPDFNVWDSNFIYYWLCTVDLKNYLQNPSYPSLTLTTIKKLPTPLPYPDDPERSLAEQRRIVARLEALLGEVKAMREQVQIMRRDVNRLMESALAEVFPSVGQPLPQGWEWKTINDLFDIQQGASMSPRRRHGTNSQLFLRTKNILWGEVDTTDLDKMDFTIDEIEKLKLRKGDLLICEGGDVGRTALWEEQIPLVLFQNHIHRLRHKDNNVEPKYYMYWMRFAYQVSKLYQGEESRTAIPNLSAGRLRNFIVPFTSITEQRRIVAYLDGIQAEVREAQKLIEEDLRAIEQLEQSILAAAFRGEL